MKKTVIAKMGSSLILFVVKVLWGLSFLQSTKCQSFPDWKSDLSLDWTRNIKLSAQCIRYAHSQCILVFLPGQAGGYGRITQFLPHPHGVMIFLGPL